MKVVIYNNTASPNVIDTFIESINAQKLKYTSFDLLKFGIKEGEIDIAISRAIQVCHITKIGVKQHFKVCYMDKEKVIIKYWTFSETGLKLVLINSGIINKFIAQIQIEITLPVPITK